MAPGGSVTRSGGEISAAGCGGIGSSPADDCADVRDSGRGFAEPSSIATRRGVVELVRARSRSMRCSPIAASPSDTGAEARGDAFSTRYAIALGE
jgi:hypothetical protein